MLGLFYILDTAQLLHSQKQMAQWAVYVTAEFYACMLSARLGCNFCTAWRGYFQGSLECEVVIHHTAMKKFTNLFEMKINSGMSHLFWECTG